MIQLGDLNSDELSALLEKSRSYFENLKQNDEFNSARIYLENLKKLFENEEFCKSEKWVNYLKEQIEMMGYLLEDANYNPGAAENIKSKYIIDDRTSQLRKKGGITTSKYYRDIEEEIILRAKEIIEKPHDSRPKEYYRASSLADAVISTNASNEYGFSRLAIPVKSTVVSYIKKAVKNGKLPDFLTGFNPGKWQ